MEPKKSGDLTVILASDPLPDSTAGTAVLRFASTGQSAFTTLKPTDAPQAGTTSVPRVKPNPTEPVNLLPLLAPGGSLDLIAVSQDESRVSLVAVASLGPCLLAGLLNLWQPSGEPC